MSAKRQDKLALKLMELAQELTTSGEVSDYLLEAIQSQKHWNKCYDR